MSAKVIRKCIERFNETTLEKFGIPLELTEDRFQPLSFDFADKVESSDKNIAEYLELAKDMRKRISECEKSLEENDIEIDYGFFPRWCDDLDTIIDIYTKLLK